MSIPSCIRPQRIPNGLVTGPLTGQIRPAADGGPGWNEPEPLSREARAALACARPAASCRYSRLLSLTATRLSRLLCRAAASPCCSASSLRRSEEHTSELQSLTNLVCRLLLEKKKQQAT